MLELHLENIVRLFELPLSHVDCRLSFKLNYKGNKDEKDQPDNSKNTHCPEKQDYKIAHV